jgi:hypothetical protein
MMFFLISNRGIFDEPCSQRRGKISDLLGSTVQHGAMTRRYLKTKKRGCSSGTPLVGSWGPS